MGPLLGILVLHWGEEGEQGGWEGQSLRLKFPKPQMVFANGTRNVYTMWDPCTQKPPGSVPDVGTASPSFYPALLHLNGPCRTFERVAARVAN